MAECLDKGVVVCLDDSVVACLDNNNNKVAFDVGIIHSLDECFEYFLFTPPLEYFLEGTLDGLCIIHQGYTNNCGCYEKYFHFSHYHEQKNTTIYQSYLYYGRERVWSETYIHLSHYHQHFIHDCDINIG